MYRCYKLTYNNDLKELIDGYSNIGKHIMESKKQSIKKQLESYINEDGTIDFTNIQDDRFPTVDSDIFISHSHKDINIINALAGWLHTKFKVDVFVDSYIWEYCDDLLKELDNKYCRHSNGTSYDYDKRNFSTTHVHLMLSTALNKMIDKTECIIFVDTNNSLSLKNDIEIGTSSAWIYSEILATQLIKETIPSRFKNNEMEKRAHFNINESALSPLYRIDISTLSHITPLSPDILRDISNKCLSGEKPYLDELYRTVKKEVISND